jgi:hypothetical protein
MHVHGASGLMRRSAIPALHHRPPLGCLGLEQPGDHGIADDRLGHHVVGADRAWFRDVADVARSLLEGTLEITSTSKPLRVSGLWCRLDGSLVTGVPWTEDRPGLVDEERRIVAHAVRTEPAPGAFPAPGIYPTKSQLGRPCRSRSNMRGAIPAPTRTAAFAGRPRPCGRPSPAESRDNRWRAVRRVPRYSTRPTCPARKPGVMPRNQWRSRQVAGGCTGVGDDSEAR